ncbi:TRAP transporter large permease subunit [Chloroflexota bacterium]
MVDMSPELVTIVMFSGILIGILLGYPLALVLGGVAMIVGVMTIGDTAFAVFRMRLFSLVSDYVILAAPLFIFMGVMVERSGTAGKLYSGLYLWFGGLRGGLAIATILMGTIMAATVGVIAASVIMLGLIAAPSMLQRGYSKELVSGSVCAGGCLGILIPPSVMLVFYGPMAAISVGKLFMGAFVPGFLLSILYCSYIAIRCWLNPQLAPPVPVTERAVPLMQKLNILVTSMLPPIALILIVLGSIFFGIAAPTEAAAVGALAATIMAAAYRRFNLKTLKETALQAMSITSMAIFIAVGASMFVAIFLKLGGGDVVHDLVLSAPGGRWGAFALIMFILFILGMFIDWLGILFLMVPLVTPIGESLGFDPLWFAMMICINLQMSFMTPPLAYAIFFFKGIVKPEWGVTTGDIIRGVIPFVIIVMIGIALCITFPQIILWLPNLMIK